jgi:hypothetical protein
MTIDVLIEAITKVGFPIAVAVFALWNSHQHEVYLQNVLDNTLKENTKAIDRLSDLIDGGLMWVKNGHEDILTTGGSKK